MTPNTRSITIPLLVAALAWAFPDVSAQSTPSHDHHQHAKDAPAATAGKAKAAQGRQAAPAATYRIEIGKAQAGEPPALKAKQGDTVKLVFASDQPGTAEVHGYKSTVTMVPGGEAALLVKADKAGSYPIHLHTPAGAHVPVATLEVAAK